MLLRPIQRVPYNVYSTCTAEDRNDMDHAPPPHVFCLHCIKTYYKNQGKNYPPCPVWTCGRPITLRLRHLEFINPDTIILIFKTTTTPDSLQQHIFFFPYRGERGR